MNVWNIYHSDGSFLTDANGEQVRTSDIELSEAWMSECFVSVSFKHNAPIDFQIGDYLIYRNERYELNYEPGKDKSSSLNSYGDGFVYDSVKFNALQDELSRTEFLDVVLHDNELHYTALSKFSFYVETIDDLLDRIQANLDEQIGKGKWKIFSRSIEKSRQRGCTDEEWKLAYGEKTPDDIVIDSKSLTVDTQTCWDALALVQSEFNVNFIIRGRNIYVGTIGVVADHIFKYGLGEGLYEIEQNADSEQQVITRLRAYGSEKNLPSHYYTDLDKSIVAYVLSILGNRETEGDEVYTYVVLDLAFYKSYFTKPIDGQEYEVYITTDSVTNIRATIKEGAGSTNKGKCVLGVYWYEGGNPYNSTSKEDALKFINSVKVGDKIQLVSGINKDNIHASNVEYADYLPNNMAVNRLMLPGFPKQSLSDFYNTLTEDEKKYVNPTGKAHKFSNDKYRPYVDSLNIDKIGLRSSSQFFDTDDKTNGVIEIYPTIEEMVVNGVRVDEINEGVTPDDDGRFEDNATVANVDIYLSPSIDFDINDLREDDFSISMKDGMCGGRTFKVASVLKENSRWRLRIERVKDEALELWFPYKDYPIRKGDHFVLTGIKLPDSYVRTASLKLLKYAIALLDKNDYTRYVYQPKVDEIFMARQHDMAMSDTTGLIKSFHDTLKAGDLLRFEDTDLGIDAEITIDQLVIKEAEGQIPTYEITLREDKEVGTIQKIQNQISSLLSGNAGTGGGLTVAQLRAEIASEGGKRFLSKLKDDTAQGLITFLKGLKSQDVIKAINGMSLGNGENYVNGNGDANLSDVVVDRIHDKNSTPSDRVIIGAQGFDLYMGDDGKSHLFVDYLTARTRMFASSVEIRKVSYSGGTTIFSNAGSQIAKVSYIYDAAKEKVIAYKCYAVADDGTTKTMNWWHVGMMALCQTFNVAAVKNENFSNRYYWRMVVGVGQETLDDGKLYDYVILSNIKEFQGNLLTIPTYSDKTLANEQKKKLVWGNVMVEVTMDEGMQTLASLFMEQEGTDVDDNGNKIADRIFYGYDGEKPDAPAPYDVIVQVGNQIQWKKYGNVIKLSTSTEDSATDNAPAITMYHKLGAPHYTGSLDANGNKIVNPYQWKIITTIISPEKVMHNTDNFQLFQGTPDNIVDPITIMYDIVPSVAYYTRHPSTQTTTPTDITFSLRKRTGNKVETLSDAQIYAEYTLLNGSSATKILPNKALSDIGNLYQITSVKLKSTIKEADHEDIVVTLDLPVLTDGVKGDQGLPGVDGAPGANGKDGEDAINIVVKDIPMVFDTEDNGLVVDGAERYASIYVYKKKENISSLVENVAVNSTENCECKAAYNSVRKCLRAKVYKVAKEDITVDGATTQISKTAGYATIRFSYNGVMFYQQVQFVVNVSKFNSSVIQTTKKYEQQYIEVSNQVGTLNTNLNNLGSNLSNLQDDVDSLDQQVTAIPIRSDQDLTTFESKITQTAREISLSLTEQAVSRRNLLVNSDFARNGGFALSTPSKATVERLSGYEGSNCIHTFTSSTSFPALRWEGYTAKTNNIPIVGGKKYTISCWVKVSNTNAPLYVKVFGQKAITGNVETTTAATGTILDKVVTLNSANTWQLVSFTFVASGGYSYCSVRLFFRPPSTTLIDGYICRPMLEQSDSYNGWTLSEEDYNYQGGNMLDNTRYLNTGGNLTQVGMLIGNAKDGCSLSEATVQQNKSATLVRFDNVSVVANTDYVLSFFIRSKVLSSKTNVVCTLNLVTNAKFAECSNGSVSTGTSANGNSTTSGYIELGNIPIEWTKVWYHFSPKNTYTNQAIAIQIYGCNGVGTLQVCQPKLEEGVNNTPWTEATEDIANKAALKRTGIDIEKGKITLDADNTVITGDLHLRGILVENYEDLSANNDLFIVCDMKAHKSVTVSHSRVILPMLDTHTIKDYNDKEYAVNGLKEAGVKLTIASKYNSYVAKWAQTTPSLFESYKDFDNRGLMKTYHNFASVVFADPRIADKGNYKIVDGIDTLVPTILPEGGGGYAATGYEGGVFVCNGRRGRALVLMPGQTLHLTSAIEYVNEKQVLVWYVDNSSDFTPLTKEVCFYSWDGYTYDHGFHSNGGSAFPMEVSDSSGSEYEDAIFGTKILDETNLDGSLHAYWGGFLTGYSD